ncbi:MAG: rubredoxin [Desulfobacteraceae bacterium]|nr:rubredoxin [Desulfobacteraceae bacterium]
MRRWKCTICNYIHEGDAPPARCPICNAPASKFIEIEPAPPEAPPEVKPVAPVRETPLDKIKALMVKHHLHPVSVHFPNGVLPVVVVFFILSALFACDSFAKAGFYNLVFVVLSLPVVLVAGAVEWEKKYNRALTILFLIKIVAASITTVSCCTSLVWFLLEPTVMASSRAWIFIGLNLVMLGSAGVAGFIGGKLVFKD